MKRPPEEIWIGEKGEAEDEDEDDEKVVDQVLEGRGETPSQDTIEDRGSIYVGADTVDLDSEIPRRFAEILDRQATGVAPASDEEVRRTLGKIGRFLGRGEKESGQGKRPVSEPASHLDKRRERLRAERNDRRDGHAKSVDREVMDLPVSSISGSRLENIRQQEDEQEFHSLCESLGREGQLQPIVVVADRHRPDRYQTVAGFRRLRAAAELGWPTIRATVCDAETSEENLYFVNASENALRFKLSGYEVGCRAQFMASRFGTSHADYARRLGLSEGRVQNLVRYLERLPADILDAWRNGDPLLNDQMLQRLAAMPHDEASEFWAGWRAARIRDSNGLKRDRRGPRRSQNRPTSVMVNRLLIAVRRNSELDEKSRELVLRVVEFCAGHTGTVPGLFDPRLPQPRKKSS